MTAARFAHRNRCLRVSGGPRVHFVKKQSPKVPETPAQGSTQSSEFSKFLSKMLDKSLFSKAEHRRIFEVNMSTLTLMNNEAKYQGNHSGPPNRCVNILFLKLASRMLGGCVSMFTCLSAWGTFSHDLKASLQWLCSSAQQGEAGRKKSVGECQHCLGQTCFHGAALNWQHLVTRSY